jgi:hypothetical protein
MAAAGVRAENGVRPHDTAEDACPDLSAVIVTNLEKARSAVIVWSADAVTRFEERLISCD